MAQGEIEKPSVLDAAARAGLGSVPVIGAVLVEAYSYVEETIRYRVRQVGETIAEECPDPEVIRERVRTDPRLATMLLSAVEAAKRSSREYKRIVMGRVVGQAFTDDAVIDDHAALLAALEDLEAPHFRYLARLELVVTGSDFNVPDPYFSTLDRNGLISVIVEGGSAYAESVRRPAGLTSFGARMLQWVRDAASDPEERKDLCAEPPS